MESGDVDSFLTRLKAFFAEFKLNGSAEAALKQINDKGYLIPYMADNRKQIKVGVMFDASERNIGQWLIEE